jgi:hypothetical protein
MLLGYRPLWQRILYRAWEAVIVPLTFLLLCVGAGYYQ